MNRTFFLFFFLCFSVLFTSCLDVTYYLKVGRNGKASMRITYKATTEYGLFFLSLGKESLKENGYAIVKDTPYEVRGVIYGKLSEVLNENMTVVDNKELKDGSLAIFDDASVKINNRVQNGFLKKKFFVSYRFLKDKELSGANNDEDWLLKGMMGSMKFNFIVKTPGVIKKTTGRIIGSDTAKWSSTFYDIFVKGKHVYLQSEVNTSPTTKLSAQNNANVKLESYQSKIDKINFKIIQVNKRVVYQKNLNKNINVETKKANKLFIKSLNMLVDFYYEEKKSYPKGMEDVKSFARKNNFDVVPVSDDSNIVYDNEKHKFDLLE